MTYGDGLLTVTPEGIIIDTGLSAREAGTAKLSQHQTESGVIISVSADGTINYSSWHWTGSHEDIAPGRKNYSVYVDGEPFDGKPLLTLMEEADAAYNGADKAASRASREKLRRAINTLSLVAENAAEQGITLVNNGPLGTLVADDGSILLLPENVFVRALDSRSDRDASRFAGCWKNTGLQGIDAWRFTLACYAYRYLSGKSAFPQEDSQLRAADYFDRNFIPLEWFCSLEDEAPSDGSNAAVIDTGNLYEAIRTNLSKAAPIQETAKQKKKASRRGVQEESKSVPLPELPAFGSRELTSYALSSEYQSQQKKLKRTRFVRQNSLAIKWCSIGALVLLFFVGSLIKDKLNAPNTKGMEPGEVLVMFYNSFDQLNATLFDASHTNNSAKDVSNYLSTMYVTAKMRQSYENIGFYTTNQWLNLNNLNGSYIFGLTNVTYTPLEKMPPVDYPADKADKFTWKVHYYIVYNMGNEEFSYIEQTDIITISWNKDRWIVTDFETVESIPYDEAAPSLTREAIELQSDEYTQDQGHYLLSQLKDKYPWLPTEEEIEKGKQQLQEGWSSTEFQKVLNYLELN